MGCEQSTPVVEYQAQHYQHPTAGYPTQYHAYEYQTQQQHTRTATPPPPPQPTPQSQPQGPTAGDVIGGVAVGILETEAEIAIDEAIFGPMSDGEKALYYL